MISPPIPEIIFSDIIEKVVGFPDDVLTLIGIQTTMTIAGWCFMLTACITITGVFSWCIFHVLFSNDTPVESEENTSKADEHTVEY